MVSESTLCKCPYEVGDVLTTRNAADPATRWPGTSWQKITDRFILGAGGSYSVGATGGEASHVLTVNEMPSHDHLEYADFGHSCPEALISDNGTGPTINGYYYSSGGTLLQSRKHIGTSSTGSGAAHNNMPPYIALYFWERIA